jgi:transcriptional regulator with XRE-family HTH domain
MEKRSETARQVASLRKTRGETQGQFAKTVGVTQPMVSAWEAGADAPSSGAFQRLGNLAPYPHNIWFWEQAGMDKLSVASAFEQLVKERGATPVDVIRVPCVRKTAQGLEDTGRLLAFPAKSVLNPSSTVCLVVDQESANFAFPAGDMFLLDISQNNSSDLSPFWREVVLVDIVLQFRYPLTDEARKRISGLSMGRLQCKIFWPLSPSSDAPFCIAAMASLGPLDDFEKAWRYDGDSKLLGQWDFCPGKAPESAVEMQTFQREAFVQGSSKIRLGVSHRILGRVIAWFRTPARAAKE